MILCCCPARLCPCSHPEFEQRLADEGIKVSREAIPSGREVNRMQRQSIRGAWREGAHHLRIATNACMALRAAFFISGPLASPRCRRLCRTGA